jgi:hypothetical protein
MRTNIKIALLFAGAALVSHAQWLNYRDLKIPRTKDGKANLTAPAPTLNGKADLSGVWQTERTPSSEYARVLGPNFEILQVDSQDVTKEFVNVFWGLKPEEEPLRPEAIAIMKQNRGNVPQCLPPGIPISTFVYAFKFVQAPQEIVMITGTGDPPRQIYLDGRKLPKDPDPTWMGYSSGRWEGETLVVETTGFNGRGVLDAFGHPRSESMHITEHFQRRDFGHMDLEMTFQDPKYYTRPFTLKTAVNLLPDTDALEFVCAENEKDRAHLGK